jgi:hypothetical protein
MEKQSTPNSNLDLSQFDYENLVGESFFGLQKYLDGLSPEYDKDDPKKLQKTVFTDLPLDFDIFEAVPVLTPPVHRTQRKLIGVKLKSLIPVQTVRITINDARNWNAQIESPQAVAGSGRYYLPQKG